MNVKGVLMEVLFCEWKRNRANGSQCDQKEIM